MIPELVQNKGDRIIYKGDTTRFRIPVNQRNANGTITPLDVSTGFTGKMTFRETPESATALLTLTDTAGLTMGNGFIDVLLSAAQAAAFAVRQMVSDCQITETASTEKKTVDVSAYRVTEDITKDS